MNLIDVFTFKIKPKMFRGKGVLHPLETQYITKNISCIREYDVNMFFIKYGNTTIAIDTGYKNYSTFLEECKKIEIDPLKLNAILLTHVDADHAGGVDINNPDYFKNAELYLGKIEENYLKNIYHRKKIGPFPIKALVKIDKDYKLIEDNQKFKIGDIEVQAFLVPGHTLGHMVYLINEEVLFTGDSIALNKEGGWSFFDTFNLDSKMNINSLKKLKEKLNFSKLKYVITSHNGYTDVPETAFSHTDCIPNWKRKGYIFDPSAQYDCFKK